MNWKLRRANSTAIGTPPRRGAVAFRVTACPVVEGFGVEARVVAAAACHAFLRAFRRAGAYSPGRVGLQPNSTPDLKTLRSRRDRRVDRRHPRQWFLRCEIRARPCVGDKRSP